MHELSVCQHCATTVETPSALWVDETGWFCNTTCRDAGRGTCDTDCRERSHQPKTIEKKTTKPPK
jgi:hypothetical protein